MKGIYRNGYKKVEVVPPTFSEHGALETGMKFNKPSRDRKYVKILALCLVPAPAKLIYPKTKHPIMKQVRDMCRVGLLDRLEKKGERRYYYKTTRKGIELLAQVLES